MIDSSFIRLCKRLNNKEISRFVAFSESPYFNKHKNVKRLIQAIKKNYPNWDNGFLERKKLFNHLFPNQTFDLKKLKYIFSYSLDLLENFFAVESLNNDPFQKKEYLMKRLINMKEKKRFERHLKALLKKDKNSLTHYEWYSTHNFADLHFIVQPKHRINKHLQTKVEQFDRYYLVEKIKNTCEMMNRQRVLKMQFNYSFSENLIEYIKNNIIDFKNSPAVLIYLQVYLTMVEPENEDNYYKLISLIKQKGHLFDFNERLNMHTYAQNYCIRRINQGHKRFIREMFTLLNKMLEDGLLTTNNTLIEGHYKNMVTIAIRLKEYDWVHHFINKYKSYLSPSVRENAYHYNLSYYYYSLKEYSKAFELLSIVEYSDYTYSLDAKVLLLKLYFETEEWEALSSLVKAHQQYLRRSKLLLEKKFERYSLLFRYAHSISKLIQDCPYINKKTALQNCEQLKEVIKNAGSITNKDWLLERIEILVSKL